MVIDLSLYDCCMITVGVAPWQQSGGYAQGVAGGFQHSMEYQNFEVRCLNRYVLYANYVVII